MNFRRTFTAWGIAFSCLLPAIASAAIVPKWQTVAGVNYRVLNSGGSINENDPGFKMITGETVSSSERIGVRSVATGALLAQTAGSNYLANNLEIMDLDADGVPELVFQDGVSHNLICLNYTVGQGTLPVRWSMPGGGASTARLAWVDFDGTGQLYAVDFDGTLRIVDHNGASVTAPIIPGPLTGWNVKLYVDDYDADGQQELLIGYAATDTTGPSVLFMLQTSTSVAVEPGIHVPPSVELGAAYPNPTFRLSRIDFRVPAAGPASLRLFDLAGREVRTLVDGPVTAGSHQATWDGRDANGRQVPAGTYFYQLNAAGQRESKRLVRMP